MYRPKARPVCKKPFDQKQDHSLDELGLFLDERDDTIRVNSEPYARYEYKLRKADDSTSGAEAQVYNDCIWFCLTKCLSNIVDSRLHSLGMYKQILPLNALPNEPHTEIWLSTNYTARQKILLVLPDCGELGVWSGRVISQESIRIGSMQKLVECFSSEEYGIIIANSAQLKWNAEYAMAMTEHQYRCSGTRRSEKNSHIPFNSTPKEHITYVITHFVRPLIADLEIIAVGWSGYELTTMLDAGWADEAWIKRVQAIVFISSLHSRTDVENDEAKAFLQKRCITILCSQEPQRTILEDTRFGTDVVSGGHEQAESIAAVSVELIQDYFTSISQGLPLKLLKMPARMPEDQVPWLPEEDHTAADDAWAV